MRLPDSHVGSHLEKNEMVGGAVHGVGCDCHRQPRGLSSLSGRLGPSLPSCAVAAKIQSQRICRGGDNLLQAAEEKKNSPDGKMGKKVSL